MNDYKLISRKNTLNTPLTFFPKGSQMPKELKFFVQSRHIDTFPKKGLSIQAFYKADFIFADGILVKSRF